MSFARLLKSDPGPIGFGFLHSLASSVGQTFFISLFVPSIAVALAISEAEFASIYAVATLASAVTLTWVGRWIDRVDLVRYSLASGALLGAACLWTAAATSIAAVTIGVLALRLAGQGLMSHVAMTATARYFERNRGSALSLVSLGHPAGEALYPALTVLLIGLLGWRGTYALIGAATAALVGVAAFLVRHRRSFRSPAPRTARPDEAHPQAARPHPHLLRSRYFVLILPLLVTASFMTTALIFHQGSIAADKGLSIEWFAISFVALAAAQVPASLFVGPAIDRFGSGWLFTMHLVPVGIGYSLLATHDDAWVIPVYFALAGTTSGMAATLRTALVADLVEPSRLGAVRSQLTAMMVIATALGPAAYGWLYEWGLGVAAVLWGSLAVMAAATGLGILAQLQAPIRRSRAS